MRPSLRWAWKAPDQLGYTIVGSVGSGEAALRTAASTPIDLALMDIHIQGAYDGIQLASELRARHNIPIVYLTAHADDMTMKRARITEPFGYLIKPFRERELHTTIELALDRYRSECELRHVHAQYEHVVEQQRQATLVAPGKSTYPCKPCSTSCTWPIAMTRPSVLTHCV